MYDAGLGVAEDPAEAVYWYARAADGDNPAAWYQLADHYDRGIGVEPNVAVAAGWYRKLADAGDVVSQNRLGEFYRDGRDDGLGEVAQDNAEAAFWFGKAAAVGYGDAQLSLGRLYAAGRGVAEEARQAYMWLTLAAEGFPPPGAERRATALRERDAVAMGMAPTEIMAADNLVAAWRPVAS
jgi:TPR repeat protein